MSFLREFVGYMRTRTDAPEDFHLNAGLVAVAAALGNRVWCDGFSSRDIYPNLWVVNIAPSGYGKSTSLDMAQSLLEKAQFEQHILPEAFSQEALARVLEKEPNGVWFHQEFAAFLGSLGREYNAGAMQWLTAMYDVPDRYVRELGVMVPKTFTLRKPCISILGASSPSWFAEAFKGNALSGGFLARFIFCPSSERGAYVAHPGPRDEGVETALALHLHTAGTLSGKANISRVRRLWAEWDEKIRRKLDKVPPEFGGMRSRAGVLALKASVLFHVSKTANDLDIDEQDMQNAIKYVDDAQAKAMAFLADEVAHDPSEGQRMKVRDIVRRHGGRITWSECLKLSKLDAWHFKKAVGTLRESNLLFEDTIDKQRWLIAISPVPVPDGESGHLSLVKSGEFPGNSG